MTLDPYRYIQGAIEESLAGTKYGTISTSLHAHTYSYSCKLNANQLYINTIIKRVALLPAFEYYIDESVLDKVQCPRFQPFPIVSTDDEFDVSFIQSANLNILGFHCDHDQRNAVLLAELPLNIQSIMESRECQSYIAFINDAASIISDIIQYDTNEVKVDQTIYDNHIPWHSGIDPIIHAINLINLRISAFRSKFILDCPKCQSSKRRYEFIKSEIERLRSIRKREFLSDAIDDVIDVDESDQTISDKPKTKPSTSVSIKQPSSTNHDSSTASTKSSTKKSSTRLIPDDVLHHVAESEAGKRTIKPVIRASSSKKPVASPVRSNTVDEDSDSGVELDMSPSIDRDDLKTFIERFFPDTRRFTMTDLQDKYKKVFNDKRTQPILRKLVEDTGLYRVTLVHNTTYITKLDNK